MTNRTGTLADNISFQLNQQITNILHCIATIGLIVCFAGNISAQQAVLARDVVAADVFNTIAVTADKSGLITLYDVTLPEHPARLSSIVVPMQLTGVELAGTSVLVAGQHGIQVLDIDNPKTPLFGHLVQLESEAQVVKAAGNLGFSASGSTVTVFNIATGLVLDQRDYTGLPIHDLAISGDSLYLLSADTATGSPFRIIKAAIQEHLGPAQASWVSSASLTTASEHLSLYAGDNLLYVGPVMPKGPQNVPSIAVIEDEGTAFQSRGAPQPIDAQSMRLTGPSQLAYITGRPASQLSILDLTDPAKTGKVLRTFNVPGVSDTVTLYRGYAYLAANNAVLQPTQYEFPSGSKTVPKITLDDSLHAETTETGNLIRLTAQVSTTEQISHVDFFVNGKKVASDGNYPFEYHFFQAEMAADEPLQVSACATDFDGVTACTPEKDLNAESTSTLKVIAVTPTAGGHTGHSTKMTVTAQFSQALDPTTAVLKNVTLIKLPPKLAAGAQASLSARTAATATPVVVSGVTYQAATRSLAIQPKSPLSTGTYQATVSSAIRSSTGRAMLTSYVWTFDVNPTTVNWVNASSGDWNTAVNWSGGAVPGSLDNVVINKTPGVKVTLSTGSPQITNLTVGTGNTLIIQGGTLAVIGTGTVANLNLYSGSLGGPGTVTVSGLMNWSGGGLTGTLNIAAKAALAASMPFNTSFYIAGGTLNNSGIVTQSFAGTPNAYVGFQLSSGAVINNLAGGIWNVANDVWIYPTDNTPNAFNNIGTFNKTGGTNTAVWTLPFSGSGPINVLSGDLNLNGKFAGKLSSIISVSGGAKLDYGQGGTLAGTKVNGPGTFNFNAATSLAGTYTFTGLTQIQSGAGAVSFANPTTMTNLNLLSGQLSGAGPVSVTGATKWTGGGITGTLNIPAHATLAAATPFNTSFYIAGGTLNNSGTVTQSFAGTPNAYVGFQLSSGAVINNLAGGIWNVVNDVWIYPTDNTANVFNNIGTFNKTGGANTTVWTLPFSGSGPINVLSGDLNLNGKFTGKLTSAVSIATKCTLDYAQGGTLAGAKVTGAGTMNFNAATNVSGAYTFAGITQIKSGAGAVSFANPATITTLNLSSGQLAGAGPVTVTAAMNWTGGGIASTLDIPAHATMAMAMPFNTSFYLAGGTINNSGVVTQSFAGTPNAYIGVQVSGGAVINNLTGGVWNLSNDVWIYPTDNSANAFNNTGTFNKVGGANTTVWTLPISGTGPINVISGDLNLNGKFTGKLAAPISINAKAILDYGQGGTLDGAKVTGAGTMNFNAATNLTGIYTFAGLTQIQSGSGAVNFANPTTITNLNLITGQLAGAGVVTVTSTMRWTGGGLTGTLSIPMKSVLTIAMPFNTSFYLAGGTINNSGTVNQSFAGTPGAYVGIQVSGNAVINNLVGGIWNLTNDVWIYPTDNSANIFNNLGTFNKVGGTSTSIWTMAYTGSGTTNIQAGTINFTGSYPSSKLSGPLTIASKATMSYGQHGTLANGTVAGTGTLILPAAATIAGTFSFSGLTQIQTGAVAVTGTTTLTNLNLISGSLGGPGTTTVPGTANWTGGGVTGTLNIPAKAVLNLAMPFNTSFYLAGGTLNNSGTVNQSFAGTPGAYIGVQVNGKSIINNLAGGIWNIISDVWMYSTDTTANIFNNAGTLNKTGGSNTSIVGVAFNNTGTANLNTGTLTLNGAFPATSKLSGTINIPAAAVLNYAQQGTLTNGKAAGAGTFNMSTSSGPNGSTNVTGTYNITVPANVLGGTLQVKANTTLNVANLTHALGTNLTVESLASLIAKSISLTGGTLNVAGKLNSTTVSLIDANLNVSGTSSVGKLNASTNSANTGKGSNVSGSGTINVTDTLTWNKGMDSVTGSFNIKNLSLASDSSLTFKLGSSALNISAKLSLDGTLTLTPGGSNPAVGTVFKVLNFTNGYLDDFLNFVLPLFGNNYLKETLTPTGLSFVVTHKPAENP